MRLLFPIGIVFSLFFAACRDHQGSSRLQVADQALSKSIDYLWDQVAYFSTVIEERSRDRQSPAPFAAYVPGIRQFHALTSECQRQIDVLRGLATQSTLTGHEGQQLYDSLLSYLKRASQIVSHRVPGMSTNFPNS